MQRTILTLVTAACALAGCGSDITQTPLTAYDLADRAVVAHVLSELPAQQRGAFATYTIHHLASSTAFCGEVLVDERGRLPVTIGDAIRLTIAREEENNRKPVVADPATLSPLVQHRMALREQLKKREQLVDKRELLLMTGDGDAGQAARLKELEAELASSAEAIAELRAAAPIGVKGL